jgi:prevent-host-death family protein
MTEVSIRELRNRGGDVVDRVATGERVIVTRNGKPVAELRPVRSSTVNRAELIRRWHRLPTVDGDALRADVDGALDPAL